MNLKGNTLDQIVERLIEAILADNIFSKDKLRPKLRAILGAWIKIQDSPVAGREPKTTTEKYIKTIEQKSLEQLYWRKQLEKQIGTHNMDAHYKSLKQHLIDQGFQQP
jgi:hypothetical protein